MLLPDRLQMLTKEQLLHQIKSYENQIKQQREMPESARLDYLFGMSKESKLQMAKDELARRKMENTILVTVNGSNMLFNDCETISYEQVLKLLGIQDDIGYTVVYTKGKNGAKGGLSKSESVEVVDFMRFNVDITTRT